MTDALEDKVCRQLFAAAADPLLVTDANGNIALANPEAQSLFGYPEAEFRSLTVESLLPDRYRDGHRRSWADCTRHPERPKSAWRTLHGLRRDGTEFAAELSLSSLGDGLVLVTIHDVTEHARAEAALRTHEEDFRHLFNTFAVAIWIHDCDSGDILDANRKAIESYGYTTLEQLQANDFWIDPPYSFAEALRYIRKAASEGPQHFEWMNRDRHGRTFWEDVLLTKVTLNGAERVLGVSHNITDRKLAQQALAEREARYRAVIETTPDGFWMLDEQGRLLAVNDAYVRRSGYSREELLTMGIADLEANESPEEVRAHIETVRRNGSDLFETRHRTKNGEVWNAEINASFSAAAGGLFFAFSRDISARKRAELALQALNAEMAELTRFQVASQTAAAIAHELNQPLNAVTAYSEAALRLLRAGNPEPDRLRHALENGARQARRAGQVVRELLDFLKQGEVQTEPVDLNATIRAVVARIEANNPRGFLTRLDLKPGLARVSANRLQVEKVLLNLIDNGIQAMREGGVSPGRIAVTVRTCADGSMAQVTVRDSGPGVDENIRHRIFEPFFTTKPRGLGMGLAISRAIIESHGGQLWVESDPGSGAGFHFTLPFAA